MMKPALLVILLLCGARFCNAQRPLEQHIIVCISFVDAAGNPLPLEGDHALEIETIPDLGRYSHHVKDFAETIQLYSEDSSFRFDTYMGKPARIGSPFSGNHYILSGVLREFAVVKPGNEDNDTMRIVLLNNNQPVAGWPFFLWRT